MVSFASFFVPSSSSILVCNLLAKSSRVISFSAYLFDFESLTLVSTPSGYKIFTLYSKYSPYFELNFCGHNNQGTFSVIAELLCLGCGRMSTSLVLYAIKMIILPCCNSIKALQLIRIVLTILIPKLYHGNWKEKIVLAVAHGKASNAIRTLVTLGNNNFNFSEIPSGIKDLSKLSYLDPSFSYFAGQIPSEMLELSRLEYLDLSNNLDLLKLLHNALQLRQPDLRSLVGKLTNLQSLYLDWVNISSPLPNSLGNLSSLTNLSLRHCNLHGTIPASLSNLSQLIHLDISYSIFSGDLPTAFGNLGSLQSLDISYCNFSSQIFFIVLVE
ncbi:hypothetical protein EZV62_018181 [Acer yangbiense]|uniref:Disease resistance R13L4/SHOC-2-like LRR domain-containing protein n=1 Tax=Acer yangbiense TaxID=1000413 RepID=A0A5C7HJ21_9ROSI|nr:hypothetical protein EZV62_018181 [Acer yangbiense]